MSNEDFKDIEAGILNDNERPKLRRAYPDPKIGSVLRDTQDTNSRKHDTNILKSRGNFRGIVLRKEERPSDDDGLLSGFLDYFGLSGDKKPNLAKVTCRIPELHCCLPVTFENPGREGAIINTYYHTFTSQSDAYQEENCPDAGEIVWLDYGDRENMSSPQLIKPVYESKQSPSLSKKRKPDPKGSFKNPPGKPGRPARRTPSTGPRGVPAKPGSFMQRVGEITPVHHPQPARELSYKQAYQELEWMKGQYGISYTHPDAMKKFSDYAKPYYEGRTLLTFPLMGVNFVYKGSRKGEAIRGRPDPRSKAIQPSLAVAVVRMALWLKENWSMDTIYHSGFGGTPGSDRHNEGRAMDITGFGSSTTGKDFFLLEDWGLAGSGPMYTCKKNNKRARLSDSPRRCPQHPDEPAGYRLDPETEVGAFFLDAFKFMQSQFAEAHDLKVWPPEKIPLGKIGDHGKLLTPDHPDKCTAVGHADHFHVEVISQDRFVYQRPDGRHSADRFTQRFRRD